MEQVLDTRRDHPRYKRGLTVIARDDHREQVCILENASSSGAGLRINPYFNLPRRFTLILADVAVPVTLAWRHDDRAGVRFGFTASDKPLIHQLLTGLRPADVTQTVAAICA